MKTFIYSVIVALMFVAPSTHAQQVNCSTVTSSNVATCCTGLLAINNATACKNYSDAQRTFGSTTNPQTTTSPATTTTPTNTTPATIQINQCKPNVSSSTYQYCCNTMRFANVEGCMVYEASIRGTIGGGQLPTTNPINSSSSNSGTIGAAPQSGAAELQQCSKIKFMSLLDILIWVKCIINVAIIPMLFALATLFFLWGVLKYIRASDSKIRQEAQKTIFAGLLGLFVMVSLWGIVKIFSTTLGTGSTVPLLQTQNLKK